MPAKLPCQLLALAQHSQANEFYARHGSAMKARHTHQVWALGAPTIVACTCIQTIPGSDGSYWLTSLFVDPALRKRGLAGQLLEQVRCAVSGPIWLFCKPELATLYHRLGYRSTTELPPSLRSKLVRYQRSKQLIAMVHWG